MFYKLETNPIVRKKVSRTKVVFFDICSRGILSARIARIKGEG